MVMKTPFVIVVVGIVALLGVAAIILYRKRSVKEHYEYDVWDYITKSTCKYRYSKPLRSSQMKFGGPSGVYFTTPVCPKGYTPTNKTYIKEQCQQKYGC